MIFGGIEVVEQQGLTKMPQKAASAWAAFDGGITGANYRPIVYVGTQVVRGVNHIFLAEQTLVLSQPIRHIVVVKINEFNDDYTFVEIEPIF